MWWGGGMPIGVVVLSAFADERILRGGKTEIQSGDRCLWWQCNRG